MTQLLPVDTFIHVSKWQLMLLKWYLHWVLSLKAQNKMCDSCPWRHKIKCASIMFIIHTRYEWSKMTPGLTKYFTEKWYLRRREKEKRGECKSREQSREWVCKLYCTLNGVAESGFIWTIGAISTTPAKSLGLSQAVRMEIAPPWVGKSTHRKCILWMSLNKSCMRLGLKLLNTRYGAVWSTQGWH